MLTFLGVNRARLVEYKRCHPRHGATAEAEAARLGAAAASDKEQIEAFYRRLYSALILFSMIQEVPIVEVEIEKGLPFTLFTHSFT